MAAAEEFLIVNEFIKFLLAGKVDEGDQKSKAVRLEPDRSLSIFSQLVALGDGRKRIIVADDNGILRIRPYEAQHPIDGAPLPGGLTTMYTEADAESRLAIEIVNISGASATCQVQRFVNGASGGFDILGAGTPVPQGVGIRLGPYDLLDTGFIQGSSNPANSCTMHLTIDRYNTVGDTP